MTRSMERTAARVGGGDRRPAPASTQPAVVLRLPSSLAWAALPIALAGLFLLAPWLPVPDPLQVDLSRALQPPSGAHWLGTDDLGRDLLSRVLHGGHLSLSLAALTVGAGLVIGVGLGAVAGLLGGRLDALVMRIVDGLLALPMLLVALALLGLIGPSLPGLLLVLVASHWMPYARLTRGLVVVQRHAPYVEAARALGASTWQVTRWHIVPHIIRPILMQASLNVGHVILTIGGLSFLGMGIQPPTPEWGAMLVEARPYLDYAPHLMLAPGLALMLMVVCFTTLGQSLE